MLKGLVKLLLVCALAAALAYLYQRHRDFNGRMETLEQNRQSVEDLRREVQDLQQRLNEASERVKKLESDPVERAAVVRQMRKFAGEDEIVYRMEGEAAEAPPAPEAPAAPAQQAP